MLALSAASVLNFATAGSPAAEQSVQNPLRPRTEESRRARPAVEKQDETPAKPARERSAKQKQNDEMMRACGAEWRAEKAALRAKGETWRSFLKDCRARKKSETPV
jgi:ParB-like chromosome segregation protein Spo0J